MSTVDPRLKRLTDRVEREQLALPITLVIHGTTITGEVVPHAVWAKHIADQLSQSESRASLFATDFVWEQDQPERDGNYLHLSGGKVISAGTAYPEHGGLFRIGIHAVSGWFLGEIQVHP